jgi:PAS domain S-box-containing protein
MDLLKYLSSSDSFMPHGYCYLWKPGLVWLHVITDVLIAGAYLSIPVTLFYFVRRRRDLPFHWMFLSFGAFIISCGATHAMEVWNLWHANYWLAGAVKGVTALASVSTALLLIPLVPAALALPKPSDLRRSEQKFRGLLEAAPDAIIIVNHQGQIALVNAQAERMFGYRRDELLNQPVEIVIPEFFRDNQQVHRSGPTGKVLELFGLRKDGTEFPVEISLSPLEAEEGISTSSAIRDITERKRSEEVLASMSRRLSENYDRVRDLAAMLISAQDDERRRIALELHDDISQRMALLSITLEAWIQELPTGMAKERVRLSDLKAAADEVGTAIRDLSHELHSTALHHLGLATGLRGLCRTISDQHRIVVELQTDETPNLPYDLSLCLFRVAQEALANAVKHGKARQIAVQLAQNASSIRLAVKDDGIGFDASSPSKGLGLESMQERVRILRGTFTLTSSPGQGTTVEVVAETARAMRTGAG